MDAKTLQETPAQKNYDRIADIPTDVLASRFVGTLIMAKGDLNKYKTITAHLIRELRGEPPPNADQN